LQLVASSWSLEAFVGLKLGLVACSWSLEAFVDFDDAPTSHPVL
jgi:hypothetical protein